MTDLALQRQNTTMGGMTPAGDRKRMLMRN
jgi:hypothetical protein